MKNIKFNKFERVAGLFVLTAIVGFVISLFSVAIKQGWFDSKIYYTTAFKNADGVHPGSGVQMSGLRAGSVEEVELTDDNLIKVRFYVLEKFHGKVKQDSAVQLVRPFIIGERVLDISLGSKESDLLAENAHMDSMENVDLMTVMSGKNLGGYLAEMGEMMTSLKDLAQILLDKKRTQSVVSIFDRVEPLMKNLNTMSIEVIKLSKQASKDEKLGVVLGQLAITTKEINAMIPEMNKQAPEMGKNISQLVSNLAVLTEQFKVVIPALAEIAPDLPHASRRAVEALDEAVVLVKAMQRSFFMRGNVEDVRLEEEAQANDRRNATEKSENRVPASEK